MSTLGKAFSDALFIYYRLLMRAKESNKQGSTIDLKDGKSIIDELK